MSDDDGATGDTGILDRDEVLFAFHQACEFPSVQQIIDWTERYPEFADDIRAHASIMWDWAAGSADPALEPDALMLEKGRTRALKAIVLGAIREAKRRQPFQPFLIELKSGMRLLVAAKQCITIAPDGHTASVYDHRGAGHSFDVDFVERVI
jgi:hypothetical protein